MSFDPIAYINEPRWLESRLGLDRIRELLDRLGRPQDRLKFVHVAGTNGKGSTCAYLASILQAAGLRTGLFTSPYLITFEERIRVDGANITLDELTEATLLVKGQAEAMADHPTEFELMTAVALVHFVRRGCDIVVLEVGLGGRLDSSFRIQSSNRPITCCVSNPPRPQPNAPHTSVSHPLEAAMCSKVSMRSARTWSHSRSERWFSSARARFGSGSATTSALRMTPACENATFGR